MKIAYNPTTAAALTAAPSNNDITFDLKGVAIYAKGVKFKGTDTTYSVFKKHTASGNTGGHNGLVPVPSYTTTTVRFLREDGTWVVPTDTKNTAGSTNSTSKLFLIGATTQAANPQTYSNSSVYTTNGTLYATTFVGNLDGTYINKLTGYKIAEAIGSITATDSLNTALGKLEFKTDFIYNDLFGTDNDDVINKWHEIVDFVDSVAEGTDITDEFVTRKTTQTITGLKTFSGTGASLLTIDRNSTNPAWIKFAKNGTLLGYIGIDNNKNPVVNLDEVLYQLLHSGNTHIKNGVITINGVTITPITSASLSEYVLKTGDTMTGVLTFNHNSGTNANIIFKNNRLSNSQTSNSADNVILINDATNTTVGRFGMYGITGVLSYLHIGLNGYNGNNLRIYSDKVTFGGSTIWHAGNDGSGSGLDADLLDGQHGSYYAAASSLGNYVTLNTELTIIGTKTFTKDITLYASSGDSPKLIFLRSTLNATSAIDWCIYDIAGDLSFRKAAGNGWEEVFRIDYDTNNSTVVGNSNAAAFVLTGTGISDFSAGTVKLDVLNIPTSSGGTTFGPGSNGQVLKSNGTTVYWASDNNSNTWRGITDSYSGTDSTISLSQKGANNLYTTAINYGTSLSPYNASATGWYLFLTLVGTTNDGLVDFIVSAAETGSNLGVTDYFHFAARPSSPSRSFVYTHLGANNNYLRDNIYVYTDDNKTYRFYMKYSSAGSWNWFCKIRHISSRGCTLTWGSTWQTANPSGTAYQASFSGAVNYASSASSATTASKLGTSTVGGTYQPIYLSSGTATACTSYAKAIKTITRSGTTFTYTCIDGTTGTFTLLDNNTDTKVTLTVTTSNASYPLLLAPSGQTATTTTTAYFDSGVTLNPSTNTIAANISGKASSADWLNLNSTLTYGASGLNYFNINGTAGNTKANNTPTSAWYHVLRMNHANSGGYLADIAVPLNDVSGIWWRQIRNGSFYGWYKVVDSNNYADILDGRYRNAKISRAGGSYSWYNIQQYNSSDANPSYYSADCAIINITSYAGWLPWIRAVDSEKGSWAIGLYTTNFHIGYIPKTNTSNSLTKNWTFYKDGALGCAGTVTATHFYESSDINLKTNIETIDTSDDIPLLKAFDWKESGEHSYGLIAQELEEQGYSELVSTKDDGYKTVNYSAALSLIVGKLQVKIKELEKEIEILKNKN